MLYDNLKDMVKHTYSLGFIEAIKISGSDTGTRIDAIANDKTVVMYGKLSDEIVELKDQVIGFSRMAVLKGMLEFPSFASDTSKITLVHQKRNGLEIPAEISFDSGSGHVANYRFMSREATEEQVKVPPFKGAIWNVTVTPTKKNLTDLAYFNSVLGSYEPTFDVVTANGNLQFNIGSSGSDRSTVPIATNITGSMSHVWSWPLVQVLSILKLGDASKCSMSFSDQGAMKIEIDSGVGQYQYILPAKSK